MHIFTNCGWAELLRKKMPKKKTTSKFEAVVDRYKDSKGRLRIKGNALLKKTQLAPRWAVCIFVVSQRRP